MGISFPLQHLWLRLIDESATARYFRLSASATMVRSIGSPMHLGHEGDDGHQSVDYTK